MTPHEFKAWFDGFTEATGGGVPTKAQWSKIKERVAQIDGTPVTERVFIDRYWPRYYYSWPSAPVWTPTSPVYFNVGNVPVDCFNSTTAMGDLGRADADATCLPAAV